MKIALLLLSLAAGMNALAAGLTPTNVTVRCGADEVALRQAGAKWSAPNGVAVTFAEGGRVLLESPKAAVSTITVSFREIWPWDHGIRVYCDAWERTYGMAGWYPVSRGYDTFCPWYTLVKRGDATDGIGVKVQPNAFVCWLPSERGLVMKADVRAGADGVELGSRVLEVCEIVTRKGEKGETPFAAARAFARMMCPNGRLPKEPVYGYNDWYCAYGRNTATNFLADAAYISACAKGLKARPYVVMDDGWQLMNPSACYRKSGVGDSGRGPWIASSPEFGMAMPDFAASIAALGAKPGLWYRPFRAHDEAPAERRTLDDARFFDPSLPELEALVRADIARFRSWGMKLVKIDYLAYDVIREWGFALRETPLKNPPKWHRRDRTAAEVVRTLYRAMREAAGDDMVIIGCNAFNHFAAGLFELQRTGDDTSGVDWARTEKMGVNTLAMRSHQDGIFFKVDADCAGLVWKDAVDWARNRQWIDLLGRSGTAVFISWFRDLADDDVRRTIAAAYARCAASIPVGEPLDWTKTRTPRQWRFSNGATRTYDWRAVGGDVDALAALLPRPVRVERREGHCDADAAKRPVIVRAPVAGAPADVADQAYVLEIAADRVTLTAASERGEIYARATLEQLVKLAGGDLPNCRIVDWPALKWRGYMNDCGRNFLDFEAVKAVIDEMARVKMNLFHWHLSDYHGWRLESKRYPGLQKPEAFARQIGRYYTQDQFRELVDYAARRGITVMPELDVPGHSLALRRGLGLATMADPKARAAVAELFEELCALAPADRMPFVHLGTDEARQLPEYCDGEYVAHWARTINRCGRRAVVWAPGIKLPKDVDVVDMAWYDNQITNSVNDYFDSARMYNGSWNPFLVSIKSATVRPCRWKTDPKRRLGAITCTWHDDNVGENTWRLFNDSMVLPSIAAFGDNYWCGDREDLPQYAGSGAMGWRMPPAGSAAFARIEDLERRLAAHRDYVLRGVDIPFPFLRQTALVWKLTDAKGKVVAENVRGGAIDLRVYAKPAVGVLTAETTLESRSDAVVGAWIDFMLYGSAYSRSDEAGTPRIGEWSLSGARVYVNGAEVPPPVWENPGAKGTYPRAVDNDASWSCDLEEQPFRDEGPTRRALTPLRLKRGTNHVKLVIPPGRQNWVMLFSPALGTSTRPREVAPFACSL